MNQLRFVRLVRCLVFKKNGQDQGALQCLNDLCSSVRFVRSLGKRTGGQKFVRCVRLVRNVRAFQGMKEAGDNNCEGLRRRVGQIQLITLARMRQPRKTTLWPTHKQARPAKLICIAWVHCQGPNIKTICTGNIS